MVVITDTGPAVFAQNHLCDLREINLYEINILTIALYGFYKD